MKRRTVWLFATGEICFLLGILVCIALKPAGLAADNGISYYGTYIATFVPYALAVLGPATFGLIVTWRTPSELWPLRFGLLFSTIMAVIVTFTPYSDGPLLDWTHTITGAILFIIQLAISFWLVAKLKWDKWALLLAGIELAAGVVCAIYILPSQGFLIQAQIVFQLAFGGLVIYSLNKLL